MVAGMSVMRTGKVIAQSGDDSFEENDTAATAKSISPGLYEQLAWRDEDWYRISWNQSGTLMVGMAFSNGDGNLDMELYRSDMIKIGESKSTTDNEYLRLDNLGTGDYLLRVFAPQNQVNDYGLLIMRGNNAVMKTVNTDNDWYLPPGVRRDADSGFFRFGANFNSEYPNEKIPVSAAGDSAFSWKVLNPEDGVYRFDLLWNKIDYLRGLQGNYPLGLRIMSGEIDKVPDWVIQKYNPPIATFKGTNSSFDVTYVSPRDPGVEKEYLKFVKALGASGIPQDPLVVFAYIHGISYSRGEELGLTADDKQTAINVFGLSSDVYRNWAIKRIDAWADAFSGVEYKLMWVGKEGSLGYPTASAAIVQHVLDRGASFREGIIEKYYFWIDYAGSTGQKLVHDPYGTTSPLYETYFQTDLNFPVINQRRARGDENENYSLWGTTVAERKHGWLMSNFRAMTQHDRFLYITSYNYDLNPPFSDYVQKSMGKTVDTSRDAWVFLNEGYKRDVLDGQPRDLAMKNFEKYLYQRDLPNARTVAVEKVYRPDPGRDTLRNPPWGSGDAYNLVARRTDRVNGNNRMDFAVEDRFINNQPGLVLLKVTYKDNNSGRWHVQYDGGNLGILSTASVSGSNSGQWKTVTWVLDEAAFGGGLPNGQDLAIVTESGDVTVKYVRLIKWSEGAGGGSLPTVTPLQGKQYDLLTTGIKPILDGQIDEYGRANEIRLTQTETGSNGSYWLLWDNGALYVGVDVNDQNLNAIADNGGRLWEDDSLELMLDVGEQGGTTRDNNDFKFLVNVLNKQRTEQGTSLSNIAFESAVVVKGTVNDNSDVDEGYEMEMRIPWAEMGISAPQAGDNWGLEIVLDDRDGAGVRYTAAWSNSDGGDMNGPVGWGGMTFNGEKAGINFGAMAKLLLRNWLASLGDQNGDGKVNSWDWGKVISNL